MPDPPQAQGSSVSGTIKTALKWSSILKRNEELDRIGKASGKPEAQPNHRPRNESIPDIILTGEKEEFIGKSAVAADEPDKIGNSLLLTATKTASNGGMGKMLDMPLWGDSKADGVISLLSPLSPIRSPVVADWKAVGSPITQNGDTMEEAMFETELKASAESVSSSSPNKPTRARRQRAMSMVERSMFGGRPFTPFDLDDFSTMANQHRSSSRAGCESGKAIDQGSPDKLPASTAVAQVAQLPQLLHEELGVGNAEEATEIFKKSSMDSPSGNRQKGESYSPIKPHSLSSMPSLFGGKMPFGPTPMLFGDNSMESEERDKAIELGNRRHTSLFGSSDWINDVRPAEFSVDEYFMGSSGLSSTVEHRRSASARRHSIAASTAFFQDFEEHLGSLSLASPTYGSNQMESSLSPAAASFHFGRSGSLVDFMSSPDAIDSASSYFGSPSSMIHPAAMKDATFQLSSYKGPLYAIEFKAGRTEIFYVLEMDGKPQLNVKVGELVIVEADRGEDLGKVTMEISVAKLKQMMTSGSSSSGSSTPPEKKQFDDDDSVGLFTPELTALVHSKEVIPKRIHRLAQPADLKLLQAKAQEEAIAMVRCQSRIRQKKLPMEVVDAEYQWDRNKLTFYFCADRRIDFRELVRDLFRIYKTRIWMCAVDKSSPRMILYNCTNGVASNGSSMNASTEFSPLSPIGFAGNVTSLGASLGFTPNFRSSQPSPS